VWGGRGSGSRLHPPSEVVAPVRDAQGQQTLVQVRAQWALKSAWN
jgi:hypothetical protein